MIRLLIIEKSETKLYKKLKEAMFSGELKTFVAQKRGKRIMHRKYPGWMNWSLSSGVIICEILSPQKPGEEWKLFSSFLGRLADKYNKDIHSINIQFE